MEVVRRKSFVEDGPDARAQLESDGTSPRSKSSRAERHRRGILLSALFPPRLGS